ncbi:hypothetical protein CCAX7_41490 [Capsulimonas corticalis]|uniref:Uncharacterized protein n=1 Tax=Capsulimonas corticalis TaxID=2219043 RepID=A0A402CY11_9BACT|nr:hypothetical protein [Capsulimonas corticalis]BDI32098.1 hypothetical protein CCAX7_41490 [Capsulimonas corticalis]
MKIRLLLLLILALVFPTFARADDLVGPYVYKSSVRLNTQHYLVYWPSPTAKEPQYLTGSWAPKLNFNVQGPLEGGSQISVQFTKPGGVKWIHRDLKTDETDADSFQSFSLDGIDLDKQATMATGEFTLNIVLTNALNGTNKPLYTGKFEVAKFHYGAAPNEVHQADYYVNHDWTLPIGQMSFDDNPENAEAPALLVKLWFRGPLDMQMLAGYLYYNGKQISSTKSEGNVSAPVVVQPGSTRPDLTWSRCTFDFAKVSKGRNGDSANNYDSMFFLDKHPGEYEIKVLRGGKLARSAKFTIGPDGALVDNGLAASNKMGKGVTLIPVTTDLSQDAGASIANYKSLAFYGNPVVGFP